MNEQKHYKEILLKAFEFHGHKCWASTAGVRAGLAALRALGVKRTGNSSELHCLVEIGDKPHPFDDYGEVMGLHPCAECGELTSIAYLRVVGDRHVCIPCSGYET